MYIAGIASGFSSKEPTAPREKHIPAERAAPGAQPVEEPSGSPPGSFTRATVPRILGDSSRREPRGARSTRWFDASCATSPTWRVSEGSDAAAATAAHSGGSGSFASASFRLQRPASALATLGRATGAKLRAEGRESTWKRRLAVAQHVLEDPGWGVIQVLGLNSHPATPAVRPPGPAESDPERRGL
eukprot:4387586-Prymnesium_polylepis.1